MKCLIFVTLASASFIFLPSATLAQTAKATEDSQTIKNEILALDQQVNDAAVSGDLQTLAKSMSDDYVGVAPNGMILRKAMIAAHYQAGALHYSSVVNSDVEIHIHDDCAVLTAIATVKGHDGDTDLKWHIPDYACFPSSGWSVADCCLSSDSDAAAGTHSTRGEEHRASLQLDRKPETL